jgi:hypothetical protein
LAVETADKFVWADKYRPSVLNDFICNKAVAAELYQLVITQPIANVLSRNILDTESSKQRSPFFQP